MVVGAPHELDGVADGCVHDEGNVAKHALSRSNGDSDRCSSTVACSVSGSWHIGSGVEATIRRNAFYSIGK